MLDTKIDVSIKESLPKVIEDLIDGISDEFLDSSMSEVDIDNDNEESLDNVNVLYDAKLDSEMLEECGSEKEGNKVGLDSDCTDSIDSGVMNVSDMENVEKSKWVNEENVTDDNEMFTGNDGVWDGE